MSGQEYVVAVPSWGRAGLVRVFDVFPQAVLWVAERQRAAYEAAHPGRAVEAVPDELDGIGTVAPKLNWLLDQLAGARHVLMIDDDVWGIGRYERGEHAVLTTAEADALVRQGFALAAELGVPLWGINILQDQRAYSVMRPFKLLSPILGPFRGHLLPHGLRYDAGVGAKEDYDLWLQAIHRYRRTLRFDKYHYLKANETRGGFAAVRTRAWELETCRAVESKWGTATIRYDTAKKNMLDARVHVAIPGC